jgi:hypothetical protein
VSHATNTLFISNQSFADEMKTMHYAGFFHQCEDDYSTVLFPSKKKARVQIWQTQTPQSAIVTKETRIQFN